MHFNLSSAICFNFDRSKSLLSGNGLKPGTVWENFLLEIYHSFKYIRSNSVSTDSSVGKKFNTQLMIREHESAIPAQIKKKPTFFKLYKLYST